MRDQACRRGRRGRAGGLMTASPVHRIGRSKMGGLDSMSHDGREVRDRTGQFLAFLYVVRHDVARPERGLMSWRTTSE
jgi:hypothetical protein